MNNYVNTFENLDESDKIPTNKKLMKKKTIIIK